MVTSVEEAGHLVAWPHFLERRRVVEVHGLGERAARRVGLKAEGQAFKPHVTVAYLSGAPLDRVEGFRQRLGLFKSEPFRVERFGLYSSVTRRDAPSLYRLEAEYPLFG